MAAPAFGSAGAAAAAASSTVNVPHPAGIQAGDLLVLLVLSKTGSVAINTPSGWSKDPTAERAQGTVSRAAWFWKRATGSESGNQAVTKASGTTLLFAR